MLPSAEVSYPPNRGRPRYRGFLYALPCPCTGFVRVESVFGRVCAEAICGDYGSPFSLGRLGGLRIACCLVGLTESEKV